MQNRVEVNKSAKKSDLKSGFPRNVCRARAAKPKELRLLNAHHKKYMARGNVPKYKATDYLQTVTDLSGQLRQNETRYLIKQYVDAQNK